MSGRRASHPAIALLPKTWHEYLDRVGKGRQEVVVTRYGRPVMKLSPVDPSDGSGPGPGRLFGYLRDTVTEHDDIVGPTGEEWDAATDAGSDAR